MSAEARMMESSDREIAMSTQNLAIRDSAPPQSSRPFEASHAHSWSTGAQDVSRHSPSEVWAGAISRLQTQESLNTSMLESHRRQLQELDLTVRNLTQELGNVFAGLNELRTEIRARPSAPPPSRHDVGDLDVLAGQVEAVTSKANEVDGLKMQLDLLKNRMKRFEEHGGPNGFNPRPRTTSSSHHESAIHEGPLPPQQGLHSHLDQPPHHQQLPPMRTASRASPIEGRSGSLHAAHAHPPLPILESQSGLRYSIPSEPHQYSTDSSRTMQASSTGSFRPSEPLPPPSSLPGWRSSESLPLSAGLPPPPQAGNSRPQTIEPEPQASGWASVNANQTAKRPFEEPRPSSYESPGSGSPKRPKLAPIMPRSSYGDEGYAASNVSQSGMGESSYRPHSRATSEVSQPHSRTIPTPDSANHSSFRFITSTGQADSQESWRPEHERRMHGHHHHQQHQHGRGRGRRGGGPRQGRRGRGGGVLVPESQQQGTPDWEKSDWSGSQVSPNGYYHALHPYAARGGRGGIGKRGRGGGGGAGGPSAREQDIPETPVQGPQDGSTDENPDGGQPTSGGKKTRTKPIRNAEGVLIRKDGRPDMRSVSSANNLRKVHAKKEAERVEMEGRTPTSARSLAPADTYSDEEDENHSVTPGTPAERDDAEDDERPTRERNEELMSRIFPHSMDSQSNVARRFFPRHDQEEASEATMKTEESEEPEAGPRDQRNGSSQMTDVVMREMSEAQAEEYRSREDKMDTVEEANEERERENEDRDPEQPSADRAEE